MGLPCYWYLRLGPGVCPKAVAKGFKCIYSNQGVWYLDHLDIPWDGFYNADPVEGISNAAKQALVLGGEVCMWSETVDPSNVQQTIWPRAAAAAGMPLLKVLVQEACILGSLYSCVLNNLRLKETTSFLTISYTIGRESLVKLEYDNVYLCQKNDLVIVVEGSSRVGNRFMVGEILSCKVVPEIGSNTITGLNIRVKISGTNN